MIECRSTAELDRMREAGRLVAEVLARQLLKPKARLPGVEEVARYHGVHGEARESDPGTAEEQ